MTVLELLLIACYAFGGYLLLDALAAWTKTGIHRVRRALHHARAGRTAKWFRIRDEIVVYEHRHATRDAATTNDRAHAWMRTRLPETRIRRLIHAGVAPAQALTREIRALSDADLDVFTALQR